MFERFRTKSGPRSRLLVVRRELPRHYQMILGVLSFVLPLSIWCVVSYVPFIWHPDIKLTLISDNPDTKTTYTVGDHLGRDYFPKVVDQIENLNKQARQEWQDDDQPDGFAPMLKRANQNIIRDIAPLAIANGWIAADEAKNDKKLYQIWGDLATGEKTSSAMKLSKANQDIIQTNWSRLSEKSQTFSMEALPVEPLLRLIPQGHPANPDYLPAPDEVVYSGYEIFFTAPRGDQPWMYQRLGQSLQIVFGGFLLSCLIAIPLGIFCGTFDFFSKLIEPFVDFFRYMPAPTFGTLLVAIFLAHDAPKIALVFVGTAFQMVLVTANTTRSIDLSLLETAQTLGAKNKSLLTRVIIPGVLPRLYNDLRILLGWSWTWLVIAELIGVKSGLTEFIETQGRFRNFDNVFPVIIAIGIIGFTTDQILQGLAYFLFPWNRSTRPSVLVRAGRIIQAGARGAIGPLTLPGRLQREGAQADVGI
jgi:NitT/TauT family transport system permease protein